MSEVLLDARHTRSDEEPAAADRLVVAIRPVAGMSRQTERVTDDDLGGGVEVVEVLAAHDLDVAAVPLEPVAVGGLQPGEQLAPVRPLGVVVLRAHEDHVVVELGPVVADRALVRHDRRRHVDVVDALRIEPGFRVRVAVRGEHDPGGPERIRDTFCCRLNPT